jgi:hypothetical protein
MAVWSVKPDWKKSIIERQIWTKEGVAGYIGVETGWRWGEFHVTTEDDTPPNLVAGVDIYNCDYECELVSLDDGCWEESDIDVQDEALRNELETFLEDNSVHDLEELGWTLDDTEMTIDCDMIIEMIEPTEPIKEEPKTEGKGWPYP